MRKKIQALLQLVGLLGMTQEKNIDVWPLSRKGHAVGLRDPPLIRGRRSFLGGTYADVGISLKTSMAAAGLL